MMFMMLWMMMTLTIIFMFLSHPLSFGLILLIQTLLISLITGLMNSDFWFSYILFLIMVGGMLILFIYMTSIASNEMFKISSKLTISIFTSIMIMGMIMWIDSSFSLNLMSLSLTEQKFLASNPSMNKYFNWPNAMTLYIIISYLLITLIMAVKITDITHGPIRQKF
uniref:NADH-ubiquinone oxidoreductase chain 6 n=1 Tax=Spiniphilus spinicornis TaxID=1799505 RepID=A0A140CVM4_9CUCU|nr:NADH dehydrogenase subunit 6 [Spiniphilus spinicornis]AMJ17348.1 NADH dehydrogenase subunit 6 [Spiniphilus spinicornis]QVM79150.1 NADH dehydrogenase subunit 6 [Spiniphilus spinicornis]